MITRKPLPSAEISRLSLGYMRLSDSAPLILARELGLYKKYGLDVELYREVSWANLRDKLAAGILDAAHLLAPLPMMSSHGAGGLWVNLITGLSLSLNGNAITLARNLWDKLGLEGVTTALNGVKALKLRLTETGEPLNLATVHGFSMHTLLLRLWLQAGGIDPDRDVRLIVLPPEQMCDSLTRGVIDGYCVGEPWNTVAVQRGVGVVIATGYDIWNNAPEKVLGVTEAWHARHPASHLRLRLALMEACAELRDPDQRVRAAELLSHRDYLDLPVKTLLPSLSGVFSPIKGGEPRAAPDFHVFSRYAAGFPWRSHADWMVRQISPLLSKPINDADCCALVQRCYRTDLYREAARYLGIPCPDWDYKSEGSHHGQWEIMPGLIMGPDRMIDGGSFHSSISPASPAAQS